MQNQSLELLKSAGFQIPDAVLMSLFLLTQQLMKSYTTYEKRSSTSESLVLQVEADMELLEVCMKTIHFHVDE